MPAKFCHQCGQEISAVSKFCPNCAAPIIPTDTTRNITLGGNQAGTYRAPGMDPSKRLGIIIGSVAAVLTIIAVFVIVAVGHQRSLLQAESNSATSPSLTTAPSLPVVNPSLTAAPSAPASQPSLVSAPSRPAVTPSLTSAGSAPPGVLPPDVAQYLKFVQNVEQQRVAISSDMEGAASMLAMAKQLQNAGQNIDPTSDSNPPPDQSKAKINNGFSDYSAKFQKLARDFSTVPPPPSCAALANAYGGFLNDYVATISKLQVALVKGDVGAAMAMQGEQKQITDTGMSADTELGSVYSRFGVPKAFSIQPEGASPSLLTP